MFANSKVIEVPGMLSCWEEAAGWECQTCLGTPSSHRISSQDGGGEQHWDHRAQPRWAVPELQWNSHLNNSGCPKAPRGQNHNKSTGCTSTVLFFITSVQVLAGCRGSGRTAAGKSTFPIEKSGEKTPPCVS